MSRSQSIDRALALAALALVLVLGALGVYADGLWTTTGDATASLSERVDAASTLRTLRPFDRAADVAYAMLRADQLVAREQWAAAQDILYRTYLDNIGNKPLRAKLREVNLMVIFISGSKAHRQHGHEGPGGTLRPEDVER